MLTTETGATVGRVDWRIMGAADSGVPVVVDTTGAFEGEAATAL